MSDNRLSYGFIGALHHKVTEEERDKFNDAQWAEDTGWAINYEGTLIYQDFNHTSSEIYEFVTIPPFGSSSFIKECSDIGKPVNGSLFFSTVWYDGGDSPMADMKLSKYKELKGIEK